ncbi:hypothetical protein F442_02981 [Phytophthora nicotianae P10297]|uniref:Uncharacterized protein n=4 Tax=Phytophthora nicotianae TaxID=4792 RepID=W2QQ84_PHYN3|nr:hypothetical protein PPTG_22178 [Phytophthora nicotianae INRA-310]ETI54121.1 hypothetical protein F443_03025 [Phytophthora nicotianae P1569]ETM53689.1 hypothetical protein L914_02861 [Phytophthora nicotianae]ETN14679.1 hypothetical protein PPTG_22178 [Phytophthora nicotianae INRA-310]ETP51947.1 hypothetical protein F442_02981 [Phytophthora nicotianae P10297]
MESAALDISMSIFWTLTVNVNFIDFMRAQGGGCKVEDASKHTTDGIVFTQNALLRYVAVRTAI